MRFRDRLRQRFQTHYKRWLDRRVPRARRVTLSHRNTYIFLSGAGAVFLVMLAVLLLTAINYHNNMVFLLTFLLASVFVIAIHQTHGHLSGLQLTGGRAQPVFAGQSASFELLLQRPASRPYPVVQAQLAGGDPVTVHLLDTVEGRVTVTCPMPVRGDRRAPRLRVENRYPLGLLRAWSWVDLDMRCLVYPRPVPAGPLPPGAGAGQEGRWQDEAGADDFRQLRDYQAGDPLKHVAWKSLAKGQPLQTKQYSTPLAEQRWIDWTMLPGLDEEARLSRLCYWVLEADREGSAYGLRLPGVTVSPSRGAGHRERVLRALALFGGESDS